MNPGARKEHSRLLSVIWENYVTCAMYEDKRKSGILCVYLDDMEERRTMKKLKSKSNKKSEENPKTNSSERSELLALVLFCVGIVRVGVIYVTIIKIKIIIIYYGDIDIISFF